MADGADLYDQDFVAWTEQQAARIRAAAASQGNLPIDWENVAEEIEGLGKSDRRELGSRLRTIIEHLLKLQHSPALDTRVGWIATIRRERSEIESLLEQSPSLASDLGTILTQAHRKATKFVKLDLDERRELTPAAVERLESRELTQDAVLGDWIPEQPSPAQR